MNILKSVEKTFSEKQIKYFKGNNSNSNILNVPYRGINNKKLHVNIYMDIDEETRIIKFTFAEKRSEKIDIQDLKSKLLNLNSLLNYGNLSMRNNSDTIEYKVEYQMNNEEFSFDSYNMFIIRCICVYEKLKEEDLI